MKSAAILLTLPIIILISTCIANKSTNRVSMNNEILNKEYDILIIYTRQERSKDSNGTEIKIGLKKNILFYYERHWGFKASPEIIKKETKTDDEFIIHINNFIAENLSKKNYSKEIGTKKKRAFNTFRYQLSVNKLNKRYKIDVSTKDTQTENKYYKSLEILFFELKSKFLLKGKYY